MCVDSVAEVGRDPLAQPADRIEPRCGKHAQCNGHGKESDKVIAQRHRLFSLVAGHQSAVDQAAQCDREHQRGRCRQHEENAREANLDAIGPQERGQSGQ